MQTWYAINQKAETPNEAEITVYDAIGAWGVSADRFVKDLKAIRADTIHVRINTPGGEVFDGFAIYNALRNHPAKIITHIDGLAASAGSVIAIAADEVRMASASYMMIHNTVGGVLGGAEEMRKEADLLEKLNATIADTYDNKAGKGRKYWLNLMDAETWFTAEEAKEQGLIDKIEEKPEPTKANFKHSFPIYNQIPDAVFKAIGLKEISAPDAPTSVSVPPVTQTQEPIMATATPSAPAQPPAAPDNGNSQGDIATFNAATIQAYIDKGRVIGKVEGQQAEADRMKAILNVCPGKYEMAVQAFIAGQSPESVKLAYDATATAEANARTRELELQKDNARLQALIATGGHQGVSMGVTRMDAQLPEKSDMDPEAQAKMEWESNPMIRQQNSNQKAWILYRTQQLKGNVRVLSK